MDEPFSYHRRTRGDQQRPLWFSLQPLHRHDILRCATSSVTRTAGSWHAAILQLDDFNADAVRVSSTSISGGKITLAMWADLVSALTYPRYLRRRRR